MFFIRQKRKDVDIHVFIRQKRKDVDIHVFHQTLGQCHNVDKKCLWNLIAFTFLNEFYRLKIKVLWNNLRQ